MVSDVRTARLQGRSARSIVHERLRDEIVGLRRPPGSPLSEAEIAGELKVSRTPVRESLILLAEEGLVDVYPQKGSFVGPIRFDDVVTAQFVRESLECASLSEVTTQAHDIEQLRRLLDQQRSADQRGDIDDFFRLDEAFHELLMTIGGHPAAWRIAAQAKAQMDRARRLSLPDDHKMTDLITQHTEVVDRLAEGDTEAAVAALRQHLRIVLDDVARIQRENPDLFDQG